MKTLGIIGFGQFGQFLVQHLSDYFEIVVSDVANKKVEAENLGVRFVSMEEAATQKIVIFAVPVQHLRESLELLRDSIRPDAVVVDVASVKVKPLTLMREVLPNSIRLLGLHPLFGPQSGQHGLTGLKVVLCACGDKVLEEKAQSFFEEDLKLQVLLRTPEEHDKEMSVVQGITHFLAKALMRMDLQTYETATATYDHMRSITRLIGHDSMELFKTIQNENSYTTQVRRDFLQAFHDLEDDLTTKHKKRAL